MPLAATSCFKWPADCLGKRSNQSAEVATPVVVALAAPVVVAVVVAVVPVVSVV
jgi:hypothetical protein